ncbi:MAG: glycosyltransferase [Thermoleophilaceae bacterium]|nr:glycosyltransferase [Thermoleophilaceae bacterium]
MPTFSASGTLAEAVGSALAQTEERLEVIVVDDGSPEPAAAALADVRDPRLRLIRHERNLGVAAARNAALAAARAPFVSQLDSDDAWEPDYLASVLPSFEDAGVGLVYSNARITGHPDGIEDYIGGAAPHPIDTFPKICEANPVPALTATMRTAAVRAVGGYPRGLRSSEDYYLYLSLAAAGWRFAYIDRMLARYSWPARAGALGYDRAAVQREERRMWLRFALRHPLTPGPRARVRSAF